MSKKQTWLEEQKKRKAPSNIALLKGRNIGPAHYRISELIAEQNQTHKKGS